MKFDAFSRNTQTGKNLKDNLVLLRFHDTIDAPVLVGNRDPRRMSSQANISNNLLCSLLSLHLSHMLHDYLSHTLNNLFLSHLFLLTL